jgi:hypothetical protein
VNEAQQRRQETLARKCVIAEIKAALGVPQLTVEARPAEVRAQQSPVLGGREPDQHVGLQLRLQLGRQLSSLQGPGRPRYNSTPAACNASRTACT